MEEKRVAVKESIYYSVADAIEDEAVAADQEKREQSELTAIPFGALGAQFASFAHYMRHMNDRRQHDALKYEISNHLWQSSRIQKAKDELKQYQSLFE